jgi:hypothetical protein
MDRLQQNCHYFKDIPDIDKTNELCLFAVKANSHLIKYVPPNRRTEELYNIAVKDNGHLIKEVPEEQRTLEMCIWAVQCNLFLIYHVPVKFLDDVTKHKFTVHNIPEIYYEPITVPENSEECPVCCDYTGDWCKIKCGHKFHIKCILECVQTSNKCPYCFTNVY